MWVAGTRATIRAGEAATVGKAHGVRTLEGHWSGNTADGIAHGEEAVLSCTRIRITGTRRCGDCGLPCKLEQVPDRVSRAYVFLILAFALLEHGDHEKALERLQPTLVELEEFAFSQWHGLASVLIGEGLRLDGRLQEARRATQHGVEIATRVRYWYAVALGARFEEARTRKEAA
jgi:hypothetical protein